MSIPATIKAVLTKADKSGVKLGEIAFSSEVAPNELIVKVRSVGINPTDWKNAIRPGPQPGPEGNVVGCDAAGDVVKIGSAVNHIKVGDRVFGFASGSSQPDNGAYSEYVRFRENVTVVIPPGMSYNEAAAFPIPYLTAVQVLYTRLNIHKPSSPAPLVNGKKPNFFVWGGSSSVGHHVVQLATLSGYRVIATASKYLKSIGADVTIDYNDSNVLDQIKAAVKENGLQYAYDTIVEKGSTDIVIDAMNPGGHVVTSLPTGEATTNRRPGVKVEFAVAYALLKDADFQFYTLFIKIGPKEHETVQQFSLNEASKLLEGWVEGKGSKLYKGQTLRVGYGLEAIQEGLEYLKAGKASAEKLVYVVA